MSFNHEPDPPTGISAAQRLLLALLLQGQVALATEQPATAPALGGLSRRLTWCVADRHG